MLPQDRDLDRNIVLLKVNDGEYVDGLPDTFVIELEFRTFSDEIEPGPDRTNQLRKKIEILVDGPNRVVLVQETNWFLLRS